MTCSPHILACIYIFFFCLDEHTILSLYATGRLEAGRSRLSDQIDVSTPSTADVANSTTSLDERKFHLKFCINMPCPDRGLNIPTCYCCQTLPGQPCFRTKGDCSASCPDCNPKCPPSLALEN
jgi:hypothetical protein